MAVSCASSVAKEPSNGYPSDPALVQACLKGDQTAWKTLVERYGRLVYSIPRRYGFCETDADEVFQEVFMILLRQLSSLRDQTRLVGWLVTITHHEVQRVVKRTRVSTEIPESLQNGDVPVVEQVENWERQQLVNQALGRLESPCRDLLTALFLETDKPSYEKIAARFGMPVGSIGPTRARCFKKLEAILMSMNGHFKF